MLAGGNALGAFEAGACARLHAGGLRPEWVVGVSIGAVNAALLAGNPEDRRVEALRSFWQDATLADPWDVPWVGPPDDMQRLRRQLRALTLGNPTVFAPRFVGGRGTPPDRIGLHDLAPLRRSLERLVDFDLLNRGPVRFSCRAVDLESGEDVIFDTRSMTVGPEHVVASCALIPEFRPVEIYGRLFGDGGLSGNLPIETVTRDGTWGGLCVVVDPFSGRGRPFETLMEAVARRFELMFASQTRRQLETHDRERHLRTLLREALDRVPPAQRRSAAMAAARAAAEHPEVDVETVMWRASDEIGLRFYDYSPQAIDSRWQGGEAAAAELVDRLSADAVP